MLSWLQDGGVIFRKTDVAEGVGLLAALRDCDPVMDGIPISVNRRSAAVLMIEQGDIDWANRGND